VPGSAGQRCAAPILSGLQPQLPPWCHWLGAQQRAHSVARLFRAGPGHVPRFNGHVASRPAGSPARKSSFTALMLSQCQAHVISHRAEPVLLTRVLSRLFIFKTLRMLCLKQNTKGGLPLNRNQAGIGIISIISLGG
jgi:hypothetical protein